MLHFRELLIAQENDLEKRAYTYHYQRSDGQMVFRYDNSTHYPNLSSAPHHKHIEDGAVIASSMPDLVSVLREIEGFVRSM